MGHSFLSTAVPVRSATERATLVRRTYGLVFLSILVTMLGAGFAFTQPALINGVMAHPFITFICMFAPLMMAMRAARQFPKNIILTFIFTFIEGIWIAPFLMIAEQNQSGVVGEAALLTFVAFGVLSLYAVMSRRDFSAWGSFFVVGLVVLFVAMIINMFMHSAAVGLWISAVGVLVFSGLLVFDTWRLLRSGRYGADDYVLTAVQIYLDLLNMFLFILTLLSGGNRSRS
jgi:FtsH-binding integral membrane protein